MSLVVSLLLAGLASMEPAVRVVNEVPCLDEAATVKALAPPLLESKLALLVMVVVRPAEQGVILSLRGVTEEGEVLLDRRFPIARSECGAGVVLLRTVLTAFLDELPKIRAPKNSAQNRPQAAPPAKVPTAKKVKPSSPPPTSVPERWRLFPSLSIGGAVLLAPSGADLAVGGALGIGGAHRVLTSATVRTSLPRRLAQGRFLSVTSLLSVGWAFAWRALRFEAQAGFGALFLVGLDFSENERRWLPYLEGRLATLYSLGPIEFGLELIGAPLSHTIRDEEQTESTALSVLRLGGILSFPL